MVYSLLAHFTDVHDHRGTLEAILKAWDQAIGVPLQFFSNKGGAGRDVDFDLLNERSCFGRLDDAAWLKLKSSRRRNAFSLETYFTNPARSWFGDLNYISCAFPHDWITDFRAEPARQSIIKFLITLCKTLKINSASFEHEDITLQSPGYDIERAIKSAFECNVGHACYLNRHLFEVCGGSGGLNKGGWTIHSELAEGCIVSIPFDYSPSTQNAAWALFDALESVGLFTKKIGDQSCLDERFIALNRVGNFLASFEARFGRTFASRYHDGLRQTEP